MNISIIVTFNIGGSLASQWAKAGHQIFLGLRDLQSFKGKFLLENPNTNSYLISYAIDKADVILVATPPQIANDQAAQFGDLQGKVIIDATNAIWQKPEPYPTAYHAFSALTEAAVVKCFNTTGFENMQNPQYGDFHLDMFMAGDDTRAKEVARQLSEDAGFENCYDFGGADQVELLEKFAQSWINLAIFQKMGREIGFKLVKR